MLVLVNDVQVYVECLMMKAGVATRNAMRLKPSLMFAQWKLGRVWGSTTKAAAPTWCAVRADAVGCQSPSPSGEWERGMLQAIDVSQNAEHCKQWFRGLSHSLTRAPIISVVWETNVTKRGDDYGLCEH